MKAELITIGDELLLGQVVDTNSSWLGLELNKMGVRVHFKSAVSDNKEAILEALRYAGTRSDIIIITGGLGPTKDDITKNTLCEFFGAELTLNQKVLDWVKSIFERRNLPMLESNNQQAMVPANCEVLWNKNGTAPGMWFYENGKAYISMPGVPFEMKSIFSEEAIPKLQSIFSFPSILHRTIQTIGIGESFLAKKIEAIENNLPQHIKLAYLPDIGTVRLRFSVYGKDMKQNHTELDPIIEELYKTIGDNIFAEGDTSLSQVLGNLLKDNNATLGTAESCTGGYIAHLLTSNPGSSAYYYGSIVSYDNSIKTSALNVEPKILLEQGAVSEACVIAMANNLRQKFNTSYAIATSGIAGPEGGSEEKPVGTVWIAIASTKGCFAKLYQMGNHREHTIKRTALTALDMLRREILLN